MRSVTVSPGTVKFGNCDKGGAVLMFPNDGCTAGPITLTNGAAPARIMVRATAFEGTPPAGDMNALRAAFVAAPLLLAPGQDGGSATGSVSVEPTEVVTPGPGSSPAPAPPVDTDELAYTGVDIEVELAVGLALITAGVAVLVTIRRPLLSGAPRMRRAGSR